MSLEASFKKRYSQGAMLLAGLEGEKVDDAKKLGLHLALALRSSLFLPYPHLNNIHRAHDERQVFTESGGLGGGAPFCLANAPVLFHLQVKTDQTDFSSSF